MPKYNITPLQVALLVAGSVVLLIGCSGRPGRIAQPEYPSGAGAAAVAAYDTDRDKALGGAELDAVPALRESLNLIDADGNGQLTAQEIDARIQSWRDSRTAQMAVTCQVTLDGAALADAQVTLEPEPFLGSHVKPASGTTGAGGAAAMSLAAEHLSNPEWPGVACGWYKIRVTSSAQQIPSRYNTETTLGCEVAPDADWVYEPGAVSLELQSK